MPKTITIESLDLLKVSDLRQENKIVFCGDCLVPLDQCHHAESVRPHKKRY